MRLVSEAVSLCYKRSKKIDSGLDYGEEITVFLRRFPV